MSKAKVFLLAPIHPTALTLLHSSPEEILPILPSSPLASTWHGSATALLINSQTTLTAQDFALAAPTLKTVITQSNSTTNIDLSAAKAAGVAIYTTPATQDAEAIAEMTLTLALCVARRVVEIDRRLLRGKSLNNPENLTGISLQGKTLGIVGMGPTGKSVAKKWLGAMHGKIIAYDPMMGNGAWVGEVSHRRVVELEELLKCSDVVSLHVGLDETTRGIMGRREFGLMKKGAIFINCADGGLVDEEALLEVLEEGKLFGAALDAPGNEPLCVKAYNQLLACENVILTPRVGGLTEESVGARGRMAVETLLGVLRGEEGRGRVV